MKHILNSMLIINYVKCLQEPKPKKYIKFISWIIARGKR